jgi:hypothetical protein
METERQSIAIRHPEAKPTGRQVYALAHELCKRAGERFPETRGAASELIERLRSDNGNVEEGRAPTV